MTTANLTIVTGNKGEQANLWIWHDGYQVDRYFEKAQKGIKEYTVKGLEDALKKVEKEDGFVEARKDDGRGDYSWVLTIIDKKHAILVGAGSEGTKTLWFEIK